MPDPLRGRRIVLGVSGSIAAFKALTLASRLTEREAVVDVVLTKAAAELIRPLAFQAITHRPVAADLFDPRSALGMDHLTLAKSAELLVVAPATADVLARLALGLADDGLTTTALASTAPLVLAPAMEPNMWRHPATQANVATLVGRGATVLGPAAGRLASGEMGEGRMVEPEYVLDVVAWQLSRGGPLAGRHVLVTAGPTREPLDPVRYLSNHSSGRMGYALALAARDLGADVTLISGPVPLAPTAGIETVQVETAAEMLAAVLSRLGNASSGEADELDNGIDALVMTAAVADYRPRQASMRKMKKTNDGDGSLALDLVPNPDILAEVERVVSKWPAAKRPVRVGFAAETEDLVANARLKLERKGLDFIVANPVPQAFGAAFADFTFVDRAGVTPLGRLAKEEAADRIWAEIMRRLAPPAPSR